jgi:hypothetical protein
MPSNNTLDVRVYEIGARPKRESPGTSENQLGCDTCGTISRFRGNTEDLQVLAKHYGWTMTLRPEGVSGVYYETGDCYSFCPSCVAKLDSANAANPNLQRAPGRAPTQKEGGV